MIKLEIVAICLNPNHFHLLVKQVSDDGASKIIQRLGAGYTRYYNEKNKRNGVLFQGPFKAEHIDSDEYLNYVVAYVNGNHFLHPILTLLRNRVSQWGMRSSLEQYILGDKNKWGNKIFKCDTSMINHRYKNGEEYLKRVKQIAQSIKDKRKKQDLETENPVDL